MSARTFSRRLVPGPERDGPMALAAAILSGSANLRGAACQGSARLFDPDVSHLALGYDSAESREEAIASTCVACPVRGACWAWAVDLRSERVTGVTAASVSVASVMRARRGRSKRAATLQAPTEPEPASLDLEPDLVRPRPSQARGARSKPKPSIHRNRNNRRHRRTR